MELANKGLKLIADSTIKQAEQHGNHYGQAKRELHATTIGKNRVILNKILVATGVATKGRQDLYYYKHGQTDRRMDGWTDGVRSG